jgi:hypothetical protein
MNRGLVLAGIATVGLLAVGCGSSSPSATTSTTTTPSATEAPAAPTPTPTPDLHAPGTQFLALLMPLNPAFTTLNNYLNHDNGQTAVQVQKHTGPYVAALRQFDAGILRMAWPSQFLADAHALVAADGAFEGNLDGAADWTTYDSWLSEGQSDLDKARSAAAIVRSDLGLPARVSGLSVY